MFNDAVSLTDATLRGKKTNTRRDELTKDEQENLTDYERVGAKPQIIDNHIVVINYYGEVVFKKKTRYKVGEIVAVAQSYKDAGYYYWKFVDGKIELIKDCKNTDIWVPIKGWTNKMYVRPDLMPEHIKMNGIRIERLQNISEDDCIREGITYKPVSATKPYGIVYDSNRRMICLGATPREAYAALIDRVSGKGTWERNPYVVVYDYELVK